MTNLRCPGWAQAKGSKWTKLIQPLDQGTFRILNLLREVFRRGYRGPVGSQCYSISAQPLEHWKQFQSRLQSPGRDHSKGTLGVGTMRGS